MQTAAILWHLYELTGSAVALGAVGLAELIPILILATLGGEVADRVDRRKVIAVSQVVQALPALGLALVTFMGTESVAMLYGVAALGAAAQAFDSSARKALIPQLAGTEALPRAMSAMDLAKNTAKLVGPALMGILVASLGLGWVYLLNSASFAIMLVAVMCIPVALGKAQEVNVLAGAAGMRVRIAEGFRFVRNSKLVRSMVLLDFWGTFTAGAEALLPIVAGEVLGLDAAGYGVLASAAALGALLSGAYLVARPPKSHLGNVIIGYSLLFGLATLWFGLSTSFVGIFVALAFVGGADTVCTVLRNTILQVATPNELRGRVTSVAMLFSKSGPRLGQMEAGLVAGLWGVSASILSGGALALITTAFIARSYPELRALKTMKEAAATAHSTPRGVES
jgi:MFS family permease